VGHITRERGGDLRRFYTKQHTAYCGIDPPARSLSVCILRQDGALLLPRTMQPRPERFLTALAPDRAELVVAVACLLPWSWRADRCARAEMPCVLGHALSLNASHGGQAKHDTRDAQKIAGLLRGGRLPQAYVSPADRRARRELLRRRRPRVRKRAERLTHGPQTNRQYHLPEIGTAIADQTHRPGGAERCADPAVPKSVEGDRALLDYDDQLLRDLEWARVQTAQPQDAPPLSWLQTVPGIGNSLRRVLLDASQALARFPRGQAGVSSGRLSTGAKASAEKR
jgi:hypothetical protein